jgi:hypothetical protein
VREVEENVFNITSTHKNVIFFKIVSLALDSASIDALSKSFRVLYLMDHKECT